MTEEEKMLESVEQKAAEAVKKELANFKKNMPEYATPEDVKKRFDQLDETVKQLGVTELKSDIATLREDVNKFQLEWKADRENATKSGKGLKELIYDQLVANKDSLAEYKNSDKKDLGSVFTVKDAVVSGRSDISGDTNAMRIPGIGQIQRRQPFLRSLFSSGQVSANNHGVIRYTDQAAITSGATNISEQAAYPQTSQITWIERNLPIEKIGDSIKISREMMDDVDYVMSEIETFLMTNIDLQIDAQLLSGNGTTPQLKGMASMATAFTAASAFANEIQDANYFDLIAIIAAQIMYGTSYVPNGVLMNPYDAVKMKLKKDSLNNYIIPAFIVPTPGGNITVDGMRIVENSGVEANTLYVGDFTRGTVYSSNSLQLEFGYENDDFTKDLVTLKGRERLALLIRNVNSGAFNKVTSISDAISSISKPVAIG